MAGQKQASTHLISIALHLGEELGHCCSSLLSGGQRNAGVDGAGTRLGHIGFGEGTSNVGGGSERCHAHEDLPCEGGQEIPENGLVASDPALVLGIRLC